MTIRGLFARIGARGRKGVLGALGLGTALAGAAPAHAEWLEAKSPISLSMPICRKAT
jgi:hypothetical protein